MKRRLAALTAVAAGALAIAGGAIGAVTFNPDTGTGFVGKGDVQLALGYNNAQLQANASSLQFTVSSVEETTWTCDRDAGPQTQERHRTTTIQGVLDSVARERNQVTGFILNGYGSSQVGHDGPPLGSCPTGWTAVDFQTNTSGGGLSVNGVPLQ
jgi:hypothetical protein